MARKRAAEELTTVATHPDMGMGTPSKDCLGIATTVCNSSVLEEISVAARRTQNLNMLHLIVSLRVVAARARKEGGTAAPAGKGGGTGALKVKLVGADLKIDPFDDKVRLPAALISVVLRTPPGPAPAYVVPGLREVLTAVKDVGTVTGKKVRSASGRWKN